jgi:flavin-binding protein dodecin
MAKKDKDSIYKVVEVVGTSTKSWADAGRKAVETAAGTLRDLRIAEVVKLDMAIENGKVRAYRARVALSFKYESWRFRLLVWPKVSVLADRSNGTGRELFT